MGSQTCGREPPIFASLFRARNGPQNDRDSWGRPSPFHHIPPTPTSVASLLFVAEVAGSGAGPLDSTVCGGGSNMDTSTGFKSGTVSPLCSCPIQIGLQNSKQEQTWLRRLPGNVCLLAVVRAADSFFPRGSFGKVKGPDWSLWVAVGRPGPWVPFHLGPNRKVHLCC